MIEIDPKILQLCGESVELKITEKQFSSLLKEFKFEESLRFLAELSKILHDSNFIEDASWKKLRSGFMTHKVTGQFVTETAIEYITNLFLISDKNSHGNLNLRDKDNILGLFNIYHNSLVDTLPEDSILGLLLQKYFQQVSSQKEFTVTLARQALLFNVDHSSGKIDLNKLLFDEIGLSIDDYICATLAFLAVLLQTRQFNLGDFSEKDHRLKKDIFTNEKMELIMKALSGTVEELREIDKADNVDLNPIYTKSRQNPLWKKPIIKLENNRYIIPSMDAYMKGALNGLYWFFESRLKDHFTRYFGKDLFEGYVGQILKDTYGLDNVDPQISYGTKQKPKNTLDWIVRDRGGYIFFDAKANRLPLAILQTGNLDLLEKDVQDKLIKTIKQMFKRMSEIPKYQEIAKFKDKKLSCVAVFYDIPFLSTAAYDGYIKNAIDVLKLELPGIENFKYSLMSVEELEQYQYVKNYISIEELLLMARSTPGSDMLSEINKIRRENKHDPLVRKNLLDKTVCKLFDDLGAPI